MNKVINLNEKITNNIDSERANNTTTSKLKVVSKNEYGRPFYGYKYYIEFEPLHEYMTNNKELYNTLEEGQTYLIQYEHTSRLIAPNTASIQIDMKNVKVLDKLEESNKTSLLDQVIEITNKCLDKNLKKQLKYYTNYLSREYQLRFNPTADSRVNPWSYLIKELETNTDIGIELEEFANSYIREANNCYLDNIDNKVEESKQKLTLYHNTTNENAIRINKEGIVPGLRVSVYGKGSEAEGNGVWCSTVKGKGYGGATITFEIEQDETVYKANDTEYVIYKNVPASDIIDIDLVVTTILNNPRESEISRYIEQFGKDKTLQVFKQNENKFVKPYDMEQFIKLVETGEKYCKGKIALCESKHKIEEKSRNELLAKTKAQTKTRYNKAAEYKGFTVIDIDTTSVFTTNSFRVTCKVGKYWDTVEMKDILYWVQLEAEKNKDYQITAHGVRDAIMNSIDGMDILVDCTCGDWQYRMAYQATKFGYKYGKPENRPAKITNPNDYGALCKHLTSMLSNKKWLQQVAGTLMDLLVKRIDDVNKFLRTKPGEELTVPNELARQNAKLGFYKKLFKDKGDGNNDNNNTNNNNDASITSNVEADEGVNKTNDDINNNDNNNPMASEDNIESEE